MSPRTASTPASGSTASGRRASARTGRPSCARRRRSLPPTYPVAPVTSSISHCILPFAPPPKPARSGRDREYPANCSDTKRHRFAGSGLDPPARLRHDGRDAEDEARPLRGLLLPPEHALRAQPRQAEVERAEHVLVEVAVLAAGGL